MQRFALFFCLILLFADTVPADEPETKLPPEQRFDELMSNIDAIEKARLEAYRELYDFVQEGLEAANGTPAQETANYLRNQHWAESIEGLKEGKRPDPWPMKVIRRHTVAAFKHQDWPVPEDIQVPKAAKSIKIDGVLDDAAWKKAVSFHKSYPFNQKDAKEEDPATYKILWDDKYLYFAFDCVDRDLIAPEMDRDDPVFSHDCVEMFILPDFRYRTYWELVIDPNGGIYDSIQCKHWFKWGHTPKKSETMKGLKIGIKLRGTLNHSDDKDQGYTVEIAVPFDQLPGYTRSAPAVGQELNLMLVRLDKTRLDEQKDDGSIKYKHEALAFQPLLSWGHNIWNYAKIQLIN